MVRFLNYIMPLYYVVKRAVCEYVCVGWGYYYTWSPAARLLTSITFPYYSKYVGRNKEERRFLYKI